MQCGTAENALKMTPKQLQFIFTTRFAEMSADSTGDEHN